MQEGPRRRWRPANAQPAAPARCVGQRPAARTGEGSPPSDRRQEDNGKTSRPAEGIDHSQAPAAPQRASSATAPKHGQAAADEPPSESSTHGSCHGAARMQCATVQASQGSRAEISRCPRGAPAHRHKYPARTDGAWRYPTR